MTLFENYEDYKAFVYGEWEVGNINELEEDGLIIPEPEFLNKDGRKTIKNRILTEEEYCYRFPTNKYKFEF